MIELLSTLQVQHESHDHFFWIDCTQCKNPIRDYGYGVFNLEWVKDKDIQLIMDPTHQCMSKEVEVFIGYASHKYHKADVCVCPTIFCYQYNKDSEMHWVKSHFTKEDSAKYCLLMVTNPGSRYVTMLYKFANPGHRVHVKDSLGFLKSLSKSYQCIGNMIGLSVEKLSAHHSLSMLV